MTQCYIQNAGGPCCCDCCDWTGAAEDTDMISDIEQRLDAGGVVPAGQCPECGALAYLDKPTSAEFLACLIGSIEGAGFLVSGPTDHRAAEHGEPVWVCNARATIAKATGGQP